MKTIKILISILFSASLLGVSLCNFQDQYEGCEQIEFYTCVRCYRRKPLGRAKGCGPVLNDTDPCERYIFSTYSGDSFCSECKPGFSLNEEDFGDSKSSCKAKNTIQGCINSAYKTKVAPQYCYSCANNTYARLPNRYKCIDVGPNAIENCEDGSFITEDGTFICARCKAPYALTKNSQACVAPAIPGCSRNDRNGGCLTCDAPNGYYMGFGNKCFKQVAKTKQLLRD